MNVGPTYNRKLAGVWIGVGEHVVAVVVPFRVAGILVECVIVVGPVCRVPLDRRRGVRLESRPHGGYVQGR